MSEALFATAQAFKARIEDAIGTGQVHVGAPPVDAPEGSLALVLFDIQPNAALRNVPRFASPISSGPVTDPPIQIETIAVDLRFLIFAARSGSESFAADPEELKQLGRIVAAFQSDPVLNATHLANFTPPPAPPNPVFDEQIVRVSLESYALDDWKRVWALFPDRTFRTSLAYLATPVHIRCADAGGYPRVQSRDTRPGVLADTPKDRAA
jgi:hypothetical protein